MKGPSSMPIMLLKCRATPQVSSSTFRSQANVLWTVSDSLTFEACEVAQWPSRPLAKREEAGSIPALASLFGYLSQLLGQIS